MRVSAVAAMSAVLVTGFGSSAWATPISASVSLTAHAGLNGTMSNDPQSASWGPLLSPLSIVASANVTSPTGAGSVTAHGAINATWGAGGKSGSVHFTNYGWDMSGGAGSYDATLNSGGNDWTYTFTADANGIFTMTYNVTASGFVFGLQGWNIDWSGPGGGLGLLDVNDPTTSGTFSRVVVAGQTYTVDLKNWANIGSAGAVTGAMDGTFDFAISGVPEPATLLLLGFGLVGLATLRKLNQDRIALRAAIGSRTVRGRAR